MICTVYRRKGGFILVPDCFKASRAAEELHGPLQHCGTIDTVYLPAELAGSIERDIDADLYAILTPELAMRLGYQAIENLPLPAGFAWDEHDWWNNGDEVALLFGHDPPVVVATVAPGTKHAGWMSITNRHRPWAYQGVWISPTRAAAMQYVAIWADDNADEVRGYIDRWPH